MEIVGLFKHLQAAALHMQQISALATALMAGQPAQVAVKFNQPHHNIAEAKVVRNVLSEHGHVINNLQLFQDATFLTSKKNALLTQALDAKG